MNKKWFVLLVYAALTVLVFAYKNPILAWIESDADKPLGLMFAFATLFALIPIIPYGVIGGVAGAAYGPWLGGLLNWSASSLAAVIFFLLVRFAFAKQGADYLKRYDKIGRFTEMFERNAFLAILFARLIPIIPAAAVNIYSPLTTVSFRVYLTATLLGKMPTMLVFAILGDQLLTSWTNMLAVLLIYALFLLIVYTVYRRWAKISGTKKVEPR